MSIQNCNPVRNDCADRTPPPTPTVERGIAFAAGRGGDPAYIELSNVELGASIELVNLSKKPDADFACDKVTLPVTGTDVGSRRVGIMLTQDQMGQLDLKPGDVFALRAVDAAGNASPAVTGAIEPHRVGVANFDGPWAGLPTSRVMDTWERSTQLPVLGPDGTTSTMTVHEVDDGRPPALLTEHLSFAANPDGTVALKGDRALEPGATLNMEWTAPGNPTPQSKTIGTTDAKGQIVCNLGKLAPGAKISITPRDRDGEVGKQVDLVYEPGPCAGEPSAPVAPGGFQFPSDKVALHGRPDGCASLAGCLLPAGATVSVQNQTTGAVTTGTVSASGTLMVDLGKVAVGTPLVLTPTDKLGNKGPLFIMTYQCAPASGGNANEGG